MNKSKRRYYVAWIDRPGQPTIFSFYWSTHPANSKSNLADAAEAYRKEHNASIVFKKSRLMADVK